MKPFGRGFGNTFLDYPELDLENLAHSELVFRIDTCQFQFIFRESCSINSVFVCFNVVGHKTRRNANDYEEIGADLKSNERIVPLRNNTGND